MKTEEELIQLAAYVAHEANVAYNSALGTGIKPLRWEQVSEEYRQGTIAGVRFAIANDFDAIKCHDSWMESKKAQGWKLDPWYSLEAKTHPGLIPFFELPVEEQMKDILFTSIVRSIVFMNELSAISASRGAIKAMNNAIATASNEEKEADSATVTGSVIPPEADSLPLLPEDELERVTPIPPEDATPVLERVAPIPPEEVTMKTPLTPLVKNSQKAKATPKPKKK